MRELEEKIDRLAKSSDLPKADLLELITHVTPELSNYLFEHSVTLSKNQYKNKIFMRGLIEFTNVCTKNCLYCGIRKDNNKLHRYHLSKKEILDCCGEGYELGFRSFVLQGGENPTYNDAMLCNIVSSIRKQYPECAISLSAGERSKQSYQDLFNAGTDRYLLRHETASISHYKKLHPSTMKIERRIQCLYDLKEIGYQVGTGFMVGSPYQTPENLVEDLVFTKELNPSIIGIGPFIPHSESPMRNFPAGDLNLTLFLIGISRLMNPKALIPSTTALGTIHPMGRELGIQAGANVIIPNLSPIHMRKNYNLYNGKLITGEEAAESKDNLAIKLKKIGYNLVGERGDYFPE